MRRISRLDKDLLVVKINLVIYLLKQWTQPYLTAGHSNTSDLANWHEAF
jgi:hypothetical protein